MLRYNYSLSTASNSQDIVLDDFYVSPDLSFVSGTTENIRICSAGDNLWVRSPYFPNDLPVKVISSELVKRNGYVLVPKTLQVHKAKTYMTSASTLSDSATTVSYVEYNGNTYFSKLGTNDFVVDGYSCTSDNSFLVINEKIYIENDKLTVNGNTFNVTINKANGLFLTDSVGNMYKVPDGWIVSDVEFKSKWVSKICIGENVKKSIECRNIGYYGHKPYIIYDGEKIYIEYFYDNERNVTGAGVKIDDNEYECESLFVTSDKNWEIGYNIYDINDYYRNSSGNAVITVDDSNYIIYFEPSYITGSGIIGIETVEENLPIIIGDRVIVHSIDATNNVTVKYDEEGQGYVCLGGRRYNCVKNLCDSVVLGGVEYELSYDGDCENPYSGMTISCKMDDDTVIYFMATKVVDGRVMSMKKVENINGEWFDLYSMIETASGTVIYSASTEYEIVHYDGIRIGDYNAKVLHYRNIFEGEDENDIVDEYDYIVLGSMLEYRLKVIGVVGSNMILCIPDVDASIYDNISRDDLVTEVLYSIQGNDFVMERRENTFGTIDLYYDTWMSASVENVEATSAYELADIRNSIHIIMKSDHYTIPIGLCKNTSQKLEYSDLIMDQYYSDEAENAINGLVDMEKDMYTPVIKVGDNDDFESIDHIEFNLHFRTRDLETWKIIEDEGSYDDGSESGQTLSANYQYCNWFVTDYYPFNTIIKEHIDRFGRLCGMSDLLGLMYFTTNDVETKREKLRKSFLRLTFFDSKNPEKQNMLGTSTLYFDCDNLLDVLNRKHDGIHYETVAKSQIADRIDGEAGYDRMPNDENSPNVLTEAFVIPPGIPPYNAIPTSLNLCMGGLQPTLNSKIILHDRYTGNNSSEGFYSYILKAFANKKEPQTVYMKAEFFHAGIGIKIPMVIATDSDKNAIQKNGWTYDNLEEFKKGYDLDSVFDRLYIPIVIEYSRKLRKFVYYISGDNNYLNTVLDDGKWVFNLFELKVKTE